MERPAVVAVESLTKRYGGHRGVEELDFEIFAGEVFGYLGPNGAGKTTTIRLLLDLIRPTAGRIEVLGLDPRARGPAVRARVGYLPGDLRLYERLTGRDHLSYFANLRGFHDLHRAERIAERLELDLDRPIRALSRGNKQKVGLVQALMHEPDVLVLDEPTSGLDPLVQHVFYELLREATGKGCAVFLSSHVLAEVQECADRVAVIREGRLVLVDSVEALRERAPARVQVRFAQPPQPDAFAALPGVRELERRGSSVVFALEGRADPLVKALARHEVLALDSHEADLEDVFLSLYRPEPADAA